MTMSDDAVSVKDAFDKASSTLKSTEEEKPSEESEDVSQDVQEEEPTTEEEVVEEVEEELEENQDEPETLENIDPDNLPDELKPLYKNLMKGFTQGRQRDAEARREAEKQMEKMQDQLNQLLSSKQEPEQTEETPRFNTPQEYYEWNAKRIAEQTVKEERINAFRDQAVKDYLSFDDRLNRNGESYDVMMDAAVGAKLDEALAKHVQDTGSELGFDYKAQLKSLVKEYDDYVDTRVKNYIEKQNQTLKKNANESKKRVPKVSKAKSVPSKMSLQDAIRKAAERSG